MAMELTKVTMNLTHRDIANAESLERRLRSPSKASAVSSALAIAEQITRKLEQGDEVLIRRRDGSAVKLFLPRVGGA